MILSTDDAALFYRAYGALLAWVNDQRRIVPAFRRPQPGEPIEPESAFQIREVLWADDGLRERFLVEGAAELASAECDLIASWAHRVSGNFVVFKHLQKHSIFLGKDVHVLGLYTPLAQLLPVVPKFVEAVLLPFRDVIVTDGLIGSPAIQIGFGGGARRSLERQYRQAKADGTIRTSLHAPAVTPVALRRRGKRVKVAAASAAQPFHGDWRITATELWDHDALDAFEPARIGFAGPRIGRLAMIAVQVDLDCRYGERNGAPLVEFSFAGDDDGHPCTGRGWATLDADGQLRGRLYLHDGDDSAFVAQRAPAAPRPAKKKRETR